MTVRLGNDRNDDRLRVIQAITATFVAQGWRSDPPDKVSVYVGPDKLCECDFVDASELNWMKCCLKPPNMGDGVVSLIVPFVRGNPFEEFISTDKDVFNRGIPLKPNETEIVLKVSWKIERDKHVRYQPKEVEGCAVILYVEDD
jgi:hypothetical protein